MKKDTFTINVIPDPFKYPPEKEKLLSDLILYIDIELINQLFIEPYKTDTITIIQDISKSADYIFTGVITEYNIIDKPNSRREIYLKMDFELRKKNKNFPEAALRNIEISKEYYYDTVSAYIPSTEREIKEEMAAEIRQQISDFIINTFLKKEWQKIGAKEELNIIFGKKKIEAVKKPEFEMFGNIRLYYERIRTTGNLYYTSQSEKIEYKLKNDIKFNGIYKFSKKKKLYANIDFDYQTEGKKYDMKKGYVEYKKDNLVVRGGDLYPSFSSYSFSTGMEGIKIENKLKGLSYHFVIGRDGAPKDNSEFSTFISGLKLEKDIKSFKTAVTLVTSKDMESSALMDLDANPALENNLISLKVKGKIIKLPFELEYIMSDYTSKDNSVKTRFNGSALEFKTSFKLSKILSSAKFVRITDNFNAVYGSTAKDKQEIYQIFHYPLSNKTRILFFYDYITNNINKHSYNTQKNLFSNLILKYSPFKDWVDMVYLKNINISIVLKDEIRKDNSNYFDNIISSFSFANSFSGISFSILKTAKNERDKIYLISEKTNEIELKTSYKKKFRKKDNLNSSVSYKNEKYAESSSKFYSYNFDYDCYLKKDLKVELNLSKTFFDYSTENSDSSKDNYLITVEHKLRSKKTRNNLFFNLEYNNQKYEEDFKNYKEFIIKLGLKVIFT